MDRLKITATDTNIIYLDTDTITYHQWVASSAQFTIFTTTSLSVVFTLLEGFHENAITKILEQIDQGKGNISTSTITRTIQNFRVGDKKFKSLETEYTDNPEELQKLIDNRITYYYDISSISFAGVEIGAFWELNDDGDLTPLA